MIIDSIMNLLSLNDEYWCYEFIHTYLHYLDERNIGTSPLQYDIRNLYPIFTGSDKIASCFTTLINIHRSAFVKRDNTDISKYSKPYGIKNEAIADKKKHYHIKLFNPEFIFLPNTVYKQNIYNAIRANYMAANDKYNLRNFKSELQVNYLDTTTEDPPLPLEPPYEF